MRVSGASRVICLVPSPCVRNTWFVLLNKYKSATVQTERIGKSREYPAEGQTSGGIGDNAIQSCTPVEPAHRINGKSAQEFQLLSSNIHAIDYQVWRKPFRADLDLKCTDQPRLSARSVQLHWVLQASPNPWLIPHNFALVNRGIQIRLKKKEYNKQDKILTSFKSDSKLAT